jgi:hypothetical protein
MTDKQICETPLALEGLGLKKCLARLRRRRASLTQLIDSLDSYAQKGCQESDLNYARHYYDLAGRLPD